jgi:hypothetical protein
MLSSRIRDPSDRRHREVDVAKKTIFVSDLTGKTIDEKDAATVTVKYADARRGQVVLDVNASEVADLAAKGTGPKSGTRSETRSRSSGPSRGLSSRGDCLDRGYDYPWVHELAGERGFTPHIRTRREQIKLKLRTPGWRARRWVVEACHSWLNGNRALLIRWSTKDESNLAMLQLACV